MNPQIRFGEDLMSRVSYVMMNPGGDAELTQRVREAVDALIGEAATEASGRARRNLRDDASSAIRSCIICFSASIRPSSAARRSR